MNEDIRLLLPRHKMDEARVEAIIARGYPAVEPILWELLEWLQDYNWPIANGLAPFLASIGSPLVPQIQRVLATNDDVWKYWVLKYIVAESPDVAQQLRDELSRLAKASTKREREEELDIVAQEILHDLDYGTQSIHKADG